MIVQSIPYPSSASDPYWASVVLMLSGDGANGSTTFTDESTKLHGNATVNGNTAVSTANKKFGTGSIAMDGTGDNATYADSADWNLDGDFTIEAWFRTSDVDANQVIVSHWNTGTADRAWILQYLGAPATNALQFACSSSGSSTTVDLQGNWSPSAGTFYHVVAERSGNVFRTYVDGAMIAKTTNSLTFYNSPTILRIGSQFTGGAEASFLNGNVDELRITKGVARYASDSGYTVPTAAFPRS